MIEVRIVRRGILSCRKKRFIRKERKERTLESAEFIYIAETCACVIRRSTNCRICCLYLPEVSVYMDAADQYDRRVIVIRIY